MKKKLILGVIFTCFYTFADAQMTPNNSLTEQNRPQKHYTPKKNWVNDPNGLVYLDGEYHLFYQHNPFGSKWGHMSWGHAVSKDLMQWEELPIALPEIQNPDGSTTMIFSGCAVVDSLNTTGFFAPGFKSGLVAIFTSHVDKNGTGLAQHQSIAFSSDKGRTWTYYAENPVLDIGLKDFRDPNVIWSPEKQKWIMTVVKPLEFKAQFYESSDLKSWSLLSEFGQKGDTSKIWECPSLVRVPVENSQESKWVLFISSGHRQKDYLAMQYFVGDFDGKSFVVQEQKEVLYVDEGKDYYAAIPYFNLPAKHSKPVMIGWVNDWEYGRDIPTGDVRGAFSFPRETSLYKTTEGYRLRQSPIVGKEWKTIEITDKSVHGKLQEVPKVYHLKVDYRINPKKEFSLDIQKNGEEQTRIMYDPKTETLSFDRTKSGNVSFHPRFPSVEKLHVPMEKNKLVLDIYVDNTVVEIYANKGQGVLTNWIFPTASQHYILLNK